MNKPLTMKIFRRLSQKAFGQGAAAFPLQALAAQAATDQMLAFLRDILKEYQVPVTEAVGRL